MLAVGGLLVAVGVLSLVRLAPESGVGGIGTAEAEPRTDHRSGTPAAPDRAGNATVAARPTASPTATTPPAGATPDAAAAGGGSTASVPVVPGSSAAARPGAPAPHRTPPTAPGTPPVDPAPTTRAPVPPTTTAPAPPPSTAPPAPAPPTPRQPGLCVPLIGLCVDLLDAPLLPGAATPGRLPVG
ncbi:hypothetical protein OG416_13010 [Streptomyces longwoodensis]|uniref:hypothetical protein n=1 Tax=Streptomyces longwoodensis TaxID=68231 RepID=UPI0030DF8245|nr:hypothetical protein OG416_13010 [Streptomyces longwoodensis]